MRVDADLFGYVPANEDTDEFLVGPADCDSGAIRAIGWQLKQEKEAQAKGKSA